MKKYKFDIIRQNVMSWSPDIRENLSSPDELHCACPGPSCPWITLDEYIPSHDYYGEIIDDFYDYIKQRNAYCKQLFKEIQKTQTHPVLNVVRHKLDRFLWSLDTFIFGYSLSSKLCCLRANIIHLFNKFKKLKYMAEVDPLKMRQDIVDYITKIMSSSEKNAKGLREMEKRGFSEKGMLEKVIEVTAIQSEQIKMLAQAVLVYVKSDEFFTKLCTSLVMQLEEEQNRNNT